MLVRRANLHPVDQVFGSWAPLGRLLDDTFGLTARDGGTTRAWVPAADIAEDEKTYTIRLEVPGVKPEHLKLELDGDRLTVSGEKRTEAEEQTEQVRRFERSYGSFVRAFVLPETVRTESISARSEHGVLTITLPKTEKAQPRSIPVTAG